MREAKRRGLPGQLERETIEAIRPIFLKYLAMKKSHMNRYRIIGVMIGAFNEALKEGADQISMVPERK